MTAHINELRSAMRDLGVDAYIVPSGDPHQNEYVPDCWQRRVYVSGFTGSAGDLAVTMDRAGLWTDSRYFLQAEDQLDGTGITLFRMGRADTPKLTEWLQQELGEGQTVGIDPMLFSRQSVTRMKKVLGKKLVCLEENPVDRVWTARPPIPRSAAEIWPETYAGESVRGKLERVRQKMVSARADALVITTLDAVAWLFNIRGRDVPFNPVLISYAIVESDRATLFLHPEKRTTALEAHLSGLAEIREYDDFEKAVRSLAGARVLMDPATTGQWVADLIGASGRPVWEQNPVTSLKAVKNPTELEGFRRAHVRDGVAMVRFLCWLEAAVPKGGVTERSAADRLKAFRAEEDLFQGESFATISAFGPHGAIVHYDPAEAEETLLEPEGLYLIDSGAQYLDGTTDITRTVALGAVTAAQRDRFTRVLRGHIDLALTPFPAGTTGNQLDTIARRPLWEAGLNYGHGTGHGVGAYLSVHEGPQAISYYRGVGVALEPGMVVSNEPGYYEAGAYGIRIENLVYVAEDEVRSSAELPFLRLENLTLCPIDRRLVVADMLSTEELAYLNQYHETVRETLSPRLDAAQRAWLDEATRTVSG